jgi:hydrogenase large subunit
MAKVVIDPVTRIEGHLGFTLETKEIKTSTGTWTVVDKAYSHTNLFRGIEIILRGRDPRDAFFITQRICGVCPAPHGEAAIQALDHAYGKIPTPAAVLIRNIIQGAYYIYDHLIHTYLLVGPEIGVVCKYPPMVPPALGKDGIRKLGLGSSYVACVDIQRKANEVVALWGGKFPHHASEYPTGVTVKPTLDRVMQTLAKMTEIWDFIVNVVIPDLMAIKERNEVFGEKVSELLDINFRGLQDLGPTYGKFLSYGLFPSHDPNEYENDWMKAPNNEECDRHTAVIHAGAWDNGTLNKFKLDRITEDVKYSRYDDKISGMKPWEVEMTVDVVKKDKEGAYAWMKAPRYDGEVYEVGPLARMIVTYGLNWKIEETNPITGETATFEWKVMNPKGSVIDRVASRVAQMLIYATKVMEWAIELKGYIYEPIARVPDYKFVPDRGEGWGLWEAPRGALLHYTKIENKRIANYCCVVPGTWLFGPRDDKGRPGPVEKALENCWLPKDLSVSEICNAIWKDADIDLSPLGINKKVTWGDALATALTPLGLAELNLEPADGAKYNTSLALMIIRSFDPCIACGVHMIVR